jgi:hypothetical protein
MSNEQKPKRRSRWQVLAAKKYPRMLRVDGDGGPSVCYVVMSKCKHEQTKCWRYILCPDFESANAAIERWNKERCSYQCQGHSNHVMWAL